METWHKCDWSIATLIRKWEWSYLAGMGTLVHKVIGWSPKRAQSLLVIRVCLPRLPLYCSLHNYIVRIKRTVGKSSGVYAWSSDCMTLYILGAVCRASCEERVLAESMLTLPLQYQPEELKKWALKQLESAINENKQLSEREDELKAQVRKLEQEVCTYNWIWSAFCVYHFLVWCLMVIVKCLLYGCILHWRIVPYSIDFRFMNMTSELLWVLSSQWQHMAISLDCTFSFFAPSI